MSLARSTRLSSLQLNAAALRQPAFSAGRVAGPMRQHRRVLVAPVKAQESSEIGTVGIAAAVAGLIAAPIVGFSEYTLATTGSGLPPGPGGAYGAAEGVSYLVVVGIVAWSIYAKVKTGSGLPSGPGGLLGAAEGLSFLGVTSGLIIAALQAVNPSPL
mmetsp:Transcript_3599/g.10460  ORF Transcript_3599/g.10460 Transcript_3599/m.10460 type:complete len:158 (+) Transcript_3599:102-575(+)